MPPPPLLLLRLGVGLAPSAPAKPHRLLPSSSPLGRCRCRRSSSSSWFSNAEPGPGDDATNNAGSRSRSRRWWSDADDLEDDEFDDDDDGGGVFGGAREVFDEPWFSKVFRAYGYVLPVILASMLVATGPQAFLMAMAIPLAQSAISFALRTFFPGPGRHRDYYPDYTGDDFEGQEYNTSKTYRDSSYQQHSWSPEPEAEAEAESEPEPAGDASTSSSSNNTETETRSGGYGGWDELDGQRMSTTTTTTRGRPAGDSAAVKRRRPRMSVSTRMGNSRYRQAPLLMRLLVAVFPVLGSWFRML